MMSRKVRNLLAALGLGVGLLTVGCSSSSPTSAPSSSPQQPAASGSSSSSAPASSTGASAASGDVAKGKTVFAANCAVCHGQNAEGLVGPDLRKIGSTRDGEFLNRWISDPPAVKPDTQMPKLPLSDPDRKSVVEYLLTLR